MFISEIAKIIIIITHSFVLYNHEYKVQHKFSLWQAIWDFLETKRWVSFNHLSLSTLPPLQPNHCRDQNLCRNAAPFVINKPSHDPNTQHDLQKSLQLRSHIRSIEMCCYWGWSPLPLLVQYTVRVGEGNKDQFHVGDVLFWVSTFNTQIWM